MSAQLQLCVSTWGMNLHECIARVLRDVSARASFLAGTAVRTAAQAPVRLLTAYLHDKADKVLDQPARLTAIATEVRERIRAHAGPPGRIHDAPAEPLAAITPLAPGAWLDARQESVPRPRPPAEGRLLSGIATWDIGRLGFLPPWAVICYERANGRVRAWRTSANASSTAPPPLGLLRALVHTDTIPTALASDGDHYWLPALGRWASVSEVMRLFGVPADAPIADVMRTINPIRAVSAFGRSVHVAAMQRAMRIVLPALRTRCNTCEPLRYASACSGIDLAAVALDGLSIPWRYEFASELDSVTADILAQSHATHGLSRAAVHEDATSLAATVHAPPVDLWVATPPCESFSRRNHTTTEETQLDSASEFDLMLNYVRLHRPAAVIIENVDEPASRSAVSAALLSVPGYTWQSFHSDAHAYGPMARARRLWVGQALTD